MTTKSRLSCPICQSGARPWASKNGFEIHRCAACGHGFVDPRPGLAELVEWYEDQGQSGISLAEALDKERQFPNSTIDAARITRRCLQLAGRGKLLDIGCGVGFFSAAARDAGFEIDPIEIAERQRNVARQMLGITPEAASFESVERSEGSFRAILMSQVLEHAGDPVGWVRKASGLLAPGGVLAVAVPNFGSGIRLVLRHRDPFVIPPVHLNFFTPKSLSILLTASGLDVAEVTFVTKVRPQAFERLGMLAPLGRRATPAIAWALDRTKRGMFLNAYGKRTV
jgi:2-polyprenyl-3-methyl-5-hydroxy-6-metoxy-1,4-benzoquinol methylase